MDNLGWGLGITAVGMGLVFSLLVALWGLLVVVMRFDKPPQPLAPADARAAAMERDTAVEAPRDGLDPNLVAAIVVAVVAHREMRRHAAAPLMRSHWPGSLLYASRWVASGRVRQNVSWQRGRR